MNNANRKTSLKWKDAIIIGGVITNTLLSTVIISQLEDIYENQVDILQNENDTYYAIGDMANYLADEINKMEQNLNTINSNSLKRSYGVAPTFTDNGNTMTFAELNRLEGAILDLYDRLTNEREGRRTLQWNFGMKGGL